jgi:hypothetical protein
LAGITAADAGGTITLCELSGGDSSIMAAQFDGKRTRIPDEGVGTKMARPDERSPRLNLPDSS